MRRTAILLVLALALLTLSSLSPARAADHRPVVAVFDIEDTRAAGQKLQPDKLRSLTDYLANKLAIGGKFKIVPRASVRAAIQAKKVEQLKQECYDEQCQIDIGREIAAEKSLATKIDLLGDECIVTSTLYDLRQSTTENSASYRGPCGRSEILTAVEQIAAKLRGDKGGTADKNIRFDTSGLPAVPVLQMPSDSDAAVAGVDFANVDVDAMEVFDAAVKAEKDDSVSIKEKIALWKVVEKKAPAYRKHASERIIAWENLARQKKQIDAIQKKRAVKLMKDWKKLARLQKLSVISDEDKQAWKDAFYVAYHEETKNNPFVKDSEVSSFIASQDERKRQAEEARQRAEEARRQAEEAKLQAEQTSLAAEEIRQRIPWVHSAPAGIDFTKSEITVAQYRACVQAGKCTEPDSKDFNEDCNWGYPNRDSHPINCLDWYQAKAFCGWAGGRLPNKDEWYAEASNKNYRIYPWGEQEPSCERVIWGDGSNPDGCGRNSTWPVCSRPAGNSVSGLCDMGGNVWEWTSSLRSENSPFRVACGGAWIDSFVVDMEASSQLEPTSASRLSRLGLRCGRVSQ